MRGLGGLGGGTSRPAKMGGLRKSPKTPFSDRFEVPTRTPSSLRKYPNIGVKVPLLHRGSEPAFLMRWKEATGGLII